MQLYSSAAAGPVPAGTSAVLTCVVSGGNPIPKIQWFRGGRQVRYFNGISK